jgi:hypothetical protein
MISLFLAMACIIIICSSSKHTYDQKMKMIIIVILGLISRIIIFTCMSFFYNNTVYIVPLYLAIGLVIYLYERLTK